MLGRCADLVTGMFAAKVQSPLPAGYYCFDVDVSGKPESKPQGVHVYAAVPLEHSWRTLPLQKDHMDALR